MSQVEIYTLAITIANFIYCIWRIETLGSKHDALRSAFDSTRELGLITASQLMELRAWINSLQSNEKTDDTRAA